MILQLKIIMIHCFYPVSYDSYPELRDAAAVEALLLKEAQTPSFWELPSNFFILTHPISSSLSPFSPSIFCPHSQYLKTLLVLSNLFPYNAALSLSRLIHLFSYLLHHSQLLALLWEPDTLFPILLGPPVPCPWHPGCRGCITPGNISQVSSKPTCSAQCLCLPWGHFPSSAKFDTMPVLYQIKTKYGPNSVVI